MTLLVMACSTPPPPAVVAPTETTIAGWDLPACDEDILCLTTVSGRAQLFLAEDGRVLEEVEMGAFAPHSSIAVFDRQIAWCEADRLTWLSLDADNTAIVERDCEFLTRVGDHTFVQWEGQYTLLTPDQFEQWFEGDLKPTWWPAGSGYSRLAQGDDAALYGAWHSTDEVWTGAGSIPLQDYDTWVWGIDMAGETLLVLDDGRWDGAEDGLTRLHAFDLEGQRLWERPVDDLARGLHCGCAQGL